MDGRFPGHNLQPVLPKGRHWKETLVLASSLTPSQSNPRDRHTFVIRSSQRGELWLYPFYDFHDFPHGAREISVPVAPLSVRGKRTGNPLFLKVSKDRFHVSNSQGQMEAPRVSFRFLPLLLSITTPPFCHHEGPRRRPVVILARRCVLPPW